MLRYAAFLTAAIACTPFMAAKAIKVTLSGEISLGVEFDSVTEYQPELESDAGLVFDIVHQVGSGVELGGNLGLNLNLDPNPDTTVITTSTATNSTTTTETAPAFEVAVGTVDIYLDGGFGTITLTTDGAFSEAESFLSVAEEVNGEEDDLALVYETPEVFGFDGTFAFDLLNGDSAGAIGYSNDIIELDIEVEESNTIYFADTTAELTLGSFYTNANSALAVKDSDVEFETALKLGYDFGTADVYVGASSYFEWAAGITFEVQDLTLNFDVSGVPSTVTASTNSLLTTTETKPDTVKIEFGGGYEFADHLSIDAGIATTTVAGSNSTTASFGAGLSF